MNSLASLTERNYGTLGVNHGRNICVLKSYTGGDEHQNVEPSGNELLDETK